MYNALSGTAGDEEGVKGCGVALTIEVAACEGGGGERVGLRVAKRELGKGW